MKVLVLAPHTDDGELGCGGTVSRMLEEGHEVFYIAFSTCTESVPEGFPADALEKEVKAATRSLGILPERLMIRNFPVRRFNEHRQDILEDMVALRKEIGPELVFMPCTTSIHQDHKVIYEEGMRAFKQATCYGYELPWDSSHFYTTAFFALEEKHVLAKADAVELYETQRFRSYADREFITGLARVRGAQIGIRYAEAFEALKIINNLPEVL